jgi:hypothetical protein
VSLIFIFLIKSEVLFPSSRKEIASELLNYMVKLKLPNVSHSIKKKKSQWLTSVTKLSDSVVLLFRAAISFNDISLLAKALITFGNFISLHRYVIDYFIVGGTST